MHKTLRSQLHQLPYNYSQCHVSFSKLRSILKEPVRKEASGGEVPISMQVVCREGGKTCPGSSSEEGERGRSFEMPQFSKWPCWETYVSGNLPTPSSGGVSCHGKLSLNPPAPVCCPSSHLYTLELGGGEREESLAC